MDDSTLTAWSDTASDIAVTHPLRPSLLSGVLSLLLFSISAAFCYFELKPLVPASRLLPLTIYTIALVSVWAVLWLMMIARRPEPAESVRVWKPAAILIICACHIDCVLLIWQLMPYGTAELQLQIVVFMIAYTPTQIISSPENTVVNRVGIVAVLGATVIFLSTHGGMSNKLLATYIAGYAVVMFVLSKTIQQTVEATVAARLASDASARELARMLTAVTTERDARTRFIAAASHDLGQPLQAAGLFFNIAMRAPSDDQRSAAAAGVRKALASTEQLLAHMLGHLRLEADAVEPQLSRVALWPVFARLAEQFTPSAQASDIRIRVVNSNLVLALDPSLLDRALGNLIANAIQHSGGTDVLVCARRHGTYDIRIWVIDNGVGIGRTEAELVFDDYFQGSDSRSVVKSGFGLGLSSARRIAELMGGTAGLELRWLKGAAFYMSFPDAGLPMRRNHAKVLSGDRRNTLWNPA